MQQQAVATGPSFTITKPGVVAERKIIWDEGVVQMDIPLESRLGEYNLEGSLIYYLQFAKTVRGGLVNIFVHGDNLNQYRGDTITAAVQIFLKHFVDGREFLYIDLHPLQAPAVVTHRLAIVSSELDMVQGDYEEQLVFETPAPLRGAIVVGPPTMKLPSDESKKVPLQLVEKKPVSEDPQLDRLLADGWEIAPQEVGNEDPSKVFLTKMKNGQPKNLVHNRPKKKK